MPSWDEVLKEIRETKSQHDYVRAQYLKALARHTGRNVITYYSGWLTKPNLKTDINDSDMIGFMATVKGMDCSKGLDLILHTQGGSPAAAEAIVSYLRSKFNNDIRVIVPQLAMSAGTMIACAAKEIVMGKQSSLGPIDPQYNGIPCYNIKMEFEEAKQDLLSNPGNAAYWSIKLKQYPAAFLKTAIDAIELSSTLVTEWLGSCMFDKNIPSDEVKIAQIVSRLNEHDDTKTHGRHLNMEFCNKIGLKVIPMETDEVLQDLILSLHHAYIISLETTTACKIIENQDGKAYIQQSQN